ncbi:MAG TPA: transmembrane 220 family protein [Saprospiraceae bacterium]|nr:transmembrane 220 family protein [Saprospiraceae bacterium]
MKIINLILGILFLLSAVAQYNDPDPWAWMALYGFVAVVLIFAALGKRNKWVPIAGIAVCVIWIATLLPEFINWLQMGMPNIAGSMKTEEPHIEYTREFLGLAFCITALAFNWRRAR